MQNARAVFMSIVGGGGGYDDQHFAVHVKRQSSVLILGVMDDQHEEDQ